MHIKIIPRIRNVSGVMINYAFVTMLCCSYKVELSYNIMLTANNIRQLLLTITSIIKRLPFLFLVHFRTFGIYSDMTVFNGRFDVKLKVRFHVRYVGQGHA